MENKLNFLSKELVEKAADRVIQNGIPKDRESSVYFVEVNKKLIPFKMIITSAAKIEGINLSHKDFNSNQYYRDSFEKKTGFKCVQKNEPNASQQDEVKMLESISFFKKLKIEEEDVTTESEKELGIKTVQVQYFYEGEIYKTKRLHYKLITLQEGIKRVDEIGKYFDESVYWLDIGHHNWPHGKGAEIEERVIQDMYEGMQLEFETFLKRIANNAFTGHLQILTKDGRSQQYGFNLTNNNHWHDLIRLIQFVIQTKGQEFPPKQFFKSLVFNWYKGERQSLSPTFGGRAIITHLLKNISRLQSKISQMNIEQVLLNKKQIILQGPPGTGKTFTAKNIAEQIILGEVSEDKGFQKKRLEATSQFKLIQFHPSFSYEDFVRGITAKSNGNQIEYITENKVLAKFAAKAYDNFLDSEKPTSDLSKEKWVEEQLQEFCEKVQEEIDEKGVYKLNDTVSFTSIDDDAFRYTGNNWSAQNHHRMKFSDIISAYINNAQNRQSIKKLEDVSGSAKQHASYYFMALEKFRNSLQSEMPQFPKDVKSELKNYILVIDEINRANLPSVLGELIYGLEYRGESVESMYAIDKDNRITIPPNLYIIGTMNTADRSVGHIDYAIRRRFAFVDVLPNINVIQNPKAKMIFQKVSKLFVTPEGEPSEYLASDFDFKDVQIGHSYFIVEDEEQLELKLKYEIIPILKEYIKDGILLEKTKEQIKKLEHFGL